VSDHKYDNPVHPTNKFGHALDLLTRNLGTGTVEGIHLDIACGFGHIAEHVVEQFGLTYVGVDIDADELAQLTTRGYEGHQADLSRPGAIERLREIIGDRRVASVTFLDGLEHLTDGSYALAAIGTVIAEHQAIAVTSVPNTTHIDLGIKTLLGDWTYTPAGLLDDTHYTLYSDRSLRDALLAGGLRPIDEYNVLVATSDQYFPTDHLGLADHTSFGAWVRSVRDRAEPNAIVNQFVWALTAVPPRTVPTPELKRSSVFLSIIIRNQGRRPQELREALLCLAGQTHQDFEVIIVAHKTTYEEQVGIETVIEEQPPSLRERISLHLLDHGQRSAPLNHGLSVAKGTYVSIFDDDDTVLADWVAEFAAVARTNSGRILRGVTLRQKVTVTSVRGVAGVRAIGAPTKHFSQKFSLAEHVFQNQSPPIGWVFPRSLHLDFGLQFDESMTTVEDWDFLLQAAEIAGVVDVEKVLAIYRWWIDRESSRTLHSQEEWRQNEAEIERRIDSRPFLLPAGDTRELRTKLRRLHALEVRVKRQDKVIATMQRQAARQARSTGKSGVSVAQPKSLRARLRLRTRARAALGLQPGKPFLGPIRRRLKLRTRARRALGRS
jgi:glycosyltransferase involved in cell wall biosynthesis/ubiquinone/menaquinone biosynthesis C-methylase UbiE